MELKITGDPKDVVKLLGKLVAIRASVQRIEKDATNSFGKYVYASEKAIKEAFRPEFDKHRIYVHWTADVPFVVGSVLFVPMLITYIDAETGASLAGPFLGAGHTRDDKGYYAAITGGIKYSLTSSEFVPTGDDPEDDKNESAHNAKPVQAQAQPRTATNSAPVATGKPQTIAKLAGPAKYPIKVCICGQEHPRGTDAVVWTEGQKDDGSPKFRSAAKACFDHIYNPETIGEGE